MNAAFSERMASPQHLAVPADLRDRLDVLTSQSNAIVAPALVADARVWTSSSAMTTGFLTTRTAGASRRRKPWAI